MSATAEAPAKSEAKTMTDAERKVAEKLQGTAKPKTPNTQTRKGRAQAAAAATAKTAPKDPKAPPAMPTAKHLREEREAAEAKKAAPKKAPRSEDPLMQMAWRMTALCTGGDAKSADTARGPIKFGAPFNTTQVRELSEFLEKEKDILAFLGGVSANKLRQFARGEISRTDLPEDTRSALKELTGRFDPKRKMWPRKTAGGCLVLHEQRKATAKSK
jgi:hypothetical protein